MSNKKTVQTKTNAPNKSTSGSARAQARPFFGPEPLRASEPPDLKAQLANAQRLGHNFAAIPVRVGPEGGHAPPEVESAINRVRGGGQPLDRALQEQMSEAMGHDFSGVRVHTDSEADALSRQLSARAFTTGADIFFRRGEYDPGSTSGRELIAHELTHVVQQEAGRVNGGKGMTVRPPDDAFEHEAGSAAKSATRVGGSGAAQRLVPEEEQEEAQASADTNEHTQCGFRNMGRPLTIQRETCENCGKEVEEWSILSNKQVCPHCANTKGGTVTRNPNDLRYVKTSGMKKVACIGHGVWVKKDGAFKVPNGVDVYFACPAEARAAGAKSDWEWIERSEPGATVNDYRLYPPRPDEEFSNMPPWSVTEGQTLVNIRVDRGESAQQPFYHLKNILTSEASPKGVKTAVLWQACRDHVESEEDLAPFHQSFHQKQPEGTRQ